MASPPVLHEEYMKSQPKIPGQYVGGQERFKDILDKFEKVEYFLHNDPSGMNVPSGMSRLNSNTAIRRTWPKLSMTRTESNTPNITTKPNSPKQNDFPPRTSMVGTQLNVPNIATKPNLPSQNDSPKFFQNGSGKTNKPTYSKDTAVAENQSKVKESDQRPNWPNKKGQPENGNNSETSTHEGNETKHHKANISNGQKMKQEKNPAENAKPNISNCWQYYYNSPQRGADVTPKPPPQAKYHPNSPIVNHRAVIDSNLAAEMFNGIVLPNDLDK